MTTSVFNPYNSLILLSLFLIIVCALLHSVVIELELVVKTEDNPMVMTCCGLNRNVPRKIMWLNNWSPNDDTPREVYRSFRIRSIVGGSRLLKSES